MSAIPGILLAGGLARRMGGGDKPMREIAGQTVLARAIARIGPQCDGLALNANGDATRFAAYGLPVIADSVAGFPGPLAGILAGMDWATEQRPDAAWILTVPADCPFLPGDLVARLSAARDEHNAEIAIAESGGRTHPVIGLWPVAQREALRRAIVDDGLRKVGLWTSRHRLARVSWPDQPFDPFFNANTPEDLAAAAEIVRLHD